MSSEALLAQRLNRMRWLAGGLLASMFALFAATSALASEYPSLNVVRAFAEAAMVGGLADWFAVTALFRRPLGLPIPHTAIIPTRKNAIGRALATFMHDHFLVPEAVEERLRGTDLAAKLGNWLVVSANAQRLSRDMAAGIDWLLRSAASGDLAAPLKAALAPTLDRLELRSALAAMLEVLASGRHAQTLIDQLVRFGAEQLESNKVRIRERIEERSPWWLPRFVDERIYDQLIAEFERILREIGEDEHHEARAQFNDRLRALAATIQEDLDMAEKGAALRDEFLAHPAMRRYLADLWQRLSAHLRTALQDPDSPARLGIAEQFMVLGNALCSDAEAQRSLNRWLRELLLYFVATYRAPLSETISATIERWDASATAERIELYLGRDLQFIRINGTVVGGLVGVVIYVLSRAFEM
jgi:uncharacterized membrane-anchored protein YjiN (DUF445 family)